MTSMAWGDWIPHWREQLLRSATFRRWAQALPMTRWIARRRAAEVFDLMAGFVYSQVLLAVVRLELLERLAAHGPQTVASLSASLGLPLSSCERLLRAAVAVQLLEVRVGGRYGLGRRGAPLAADAGLRALVCHHQALYRDLSDPVALLRGDTGPGELARFWPYALQAGDAGNAPQAKAYSALMAATQPMVAEQLLQVYPLHQHRRLLDVGGGEGAFACAAALHSPGLRVEVFDLPEVAKRARTKLALAGLGARSQVWPGSFLTDSLPLGADLITLIRVVHDHNDEAVVTLLRAVCSALAPGGQLLLAEPMADTQGASAMGDAYFGFYLLAMGQGKPRSAAELTALLLQAGFERVRPLRTRMPLLLQLLVADSPSKTRV